MSAGVKYVPPWKLALIEKRRKQEEEDRVRRREEEERLTQMPTWKRDILLKKQQQKNSLVFYAKPTSNSYSDLEGSPRENSETIAHELLALDDSINIDNHVSEQVPVSYHDAPIDSVLHHSIGDSTGLGTGMVGSPIEEHIIPIQHNPWLRTDIKQRKYSRHNRPASYSDQYDTVTNSYNSLPRNHGSSSWREPGDVNYSSNEADTEEDEILNDNQEVAYGRGFVHKLLKKFKHLSARDDKVAVTVTAVGPKRAHSTENILEDSYVSEKSSPRHYSAASDVSDGGHSPGIYSSPVKARSMENLAGSNKHSHPSLDVKIVTERRDSSQGSLDGSFSSGSVQSPRSTAGNDAANHYNICDEEPSNSLERQVAPPEEPMPPLKRYGSSENLIEDELPRANIVSATRSLFENVTGTLTINKTKRKAPSPKVESVEFKPLPNGSVKEPENLGSSPTASRMEGHSKDGISLKDGAVPQVNGEPDNDRNANYKLERSGVFNETRTGIGPAVARSKLDQASFNGGWSGSVAAQESNAKIASSHSIIQKNNQNNNRLSAANSPTANNMPSEIISPDKESSIKTEYNLANSSKKRTAPFPLSSASGTSMAHVSVIQVNSDDVHTSMAQPKKPNLYLDLSSSESRAAPAKQPKEESLSYRDLYFQKSTPSPSFLSTSIKKDIPSQEDQKELINTNSEMQQNGVLDTMSTSGSTSPKLSSSTSIKPETSPPTINSSSNTVIKNIINEPSKAKPVTSNIAISTSFPSSKHSAAPNSSSQSNTSSTQGRPAAPPSSKPANGHAASLTLPIPKAGEVTLNTKKSVAKKGKRPASSSSSGPGSLLIRPASNLVPTSSNSNAQLPSIKKYKDVTKGVFQPPSANPTYLKGLEDEFDIPITNIDDVMDDVPVTNIDDLGDSMLSLPRMEQDADKERQILSSRYDFVGAGVSTSKNMLVKTRIQKLRITFNDSMTSTYEYPSEQSLLEELPPEPGDFDYIHQLHRQPGEPAPNDHFGNDSDDNTEELNLKAGATLQSIPGLGSAGGLMSYRSRYMGDYQLGVESKQSSNLPKQPEKEVVVEESVQITPAEDDDTYNWSNAATSDLLF